MPFWQLTVPATAETSEGLTNFLWERRALGVVEEEVPGRSPRLRAFFPERASSIGLLTAVQVYQASLRALGFSLPPGSAAGGAPGAAGWRRGGAAARRGVGERLAAIVPGARGRSTPPGDAAVARRARARLRRAERGAGRRPGSGGGG